MAADILALLSHGLVATTSSGTCDYPVVGDVRLGTVYGDGAYTGTLFIPEDTVSVEDAYSPAHIVSKMLINMGYGGNPLVSPLPSWPVYVNAEPTQPDNVITVYDTSHAPDHGRVHNTGEMQGPDGIQIRVRAKDPQDGWAKANQLRKLLESRSQGAYNRNVIMGDITYQIHSFNKISNVMVLGKESPTSVRRVFTINCSVVVDECQ